MTCYRFCLHYWSHLGSILVGHTLLIPLVKNKTHYYTFESNLKHTLIKYWPGRMNSLARSISGFPEKKNGSMSCFAEALERQTPHTVHRMSHRVQSGASILPDVVPASVPSAHTQSGAIMHPDVFLAHIPPAYMQPSTSGTSIGQTEIYSKLSYLQNRTCH